MREAYSNTHLGADYATDLHIGLFKLLKILVEQFEIHVVLALVRLQQSY